MFLLTFLVVNMTDTKRKLENDIFAAAGIAQKYNCALTRLDYQQEAGLMSSIPLGENLIPIQRGLTTSSTAIFYPVHHAGAISDRVCPVLWAERFKQQHDTLRPQAA